MKYFAYGSNMLTSRLEQRLGKVDDGGTAILENHQIIFNKKSSVDYTGKTNVVKIEGGQVVGVVFELTEEQFLLLDGNEGGYHRQTIDVLIDGELTPVITYLANDNRIDNKLLPTVEYRQHLIDGAIEHNFPKEYIAALRNTPTT
jgi:gamma-glutamylcyclotransferase